MTTRTFSGRVDEGLLAFADSVAKREYGLSFGQYCGTVLLDAVKRTGKMPDVSAKGDLSSKAEAASFIKSFSSRARHPEIGKLSDSEIKELIASRYDS